jgi:hypothetical protein
VGLPQARWIASQAPALQAGVLDFSWKNSPTLEARKEGLYTGIGCMSMELVAAIEPHQVFEFQPESFVADGAPEKDQGLAIELATFACQLIQLFRLADMHTADLIHPHRQLFFFASAKAVNSLWDKTTLQGLKPFSVIKGMVSNWYIREWANMFAV